MTDLASPLPVTDDVPLRRRLARFFAAWPPATLAALVWIGPMLVVAFGADWLAPYSFTAFDLKARLNPPVLMRSEEHTSELQSLMRTSYAVCCFKKQKKPNST